MGATPRSSVTTAAPRSRVLVSCAWPDLTVSEEHDVFGKQVYLAPGGSYPWLKAEYLRLGVDLHAMITFASQRDHLAPAHGRLPSGA